MNVKDAELDRLSELLTLRDKITQVESALHEQGHLPTQFLPAVQAGNLTTLLIAADYQDDAGRLDDAVLLRSAYYRFAGESPVVGNIHYNTGGTFQSPVLYGMRAATVTEGESIRIVSLMNEPHELEIGSLCQHPGKNDYQGMGKVVAISLGTVRVVSSDGEFSVSVSDFVRLNWHPVEMNTGTIGSPGSYNYASAKSQ